MNTSESRVALMDTHQNLNLKPAASTWQTIAVGTPVIRRPPRRSGRAR